MKDQDENDTLFKNITREFFLFLQRQEFIFDLRIKNFYFSHGI